MNIDKLDLQQPLKPLNIERALKLILLKGYGRGGAKNRIYRVGVELEGGWNKVPEGCTVIRDGSVNIPQKPNHNEAVYNQMLELSRQIDRAETLAQSGVLRTQYRTLEQQYTKGNLQIGEVPSEPMEVTTVPIWMKKYYPQVVNASCGMHVHMSFIRSFHYARLMQPEFTPTIIEHITQWAKEEGLEKDHCLWSRLRGESEFCQPLFAPDLQAKRTKKEYERHAPGHRYTMVNYGYGTHGTMECRLLPMMATPEQGIRAVQRILDITNACLIQRSREEKFNASVIDTGEIFKEERLERI